MAAEPTASHSFVLFSLSAEQITPSLIYALQTTQVVTTRWRRRVARETALRFHK